MDYKTFRECVRNVMEKERKYLEEKGYDDLIKSIYETAMEMALSDIAIELYTKNCFNS